MLTVRDIMQKDVVTATTDTTARHLARLLADEEISGVPVLDTKGSLAGVVSATDLVRLAAEEVGVQARSSEVALDVDRVLEEELGVDSRAEEPDPYGFFLPEDSPSFGQDFLEQLHESDFDAKLVEDIMTPVSFTVGPTTTLPELCALLVRRGIHRAVVVEGGRLLGIVTSVDVLRAVAERRVA